MSTPTPTLRELMAAGAHFGHKKERSHPKAKPFIYVLREGIYIIDLEKTQVGLERALAVVSDMAARGKTILFVGTKPQASALVKAAAESAGMPFIVNHWPGGLLTNFETIAQNLKRLEALEAKLVAEDDLMTTKKEKRVIDEKIRKSIAVLGGVRDMNGLPDALFVVDVITEATAVNEAYRLGIPVIGVCDTNANPENIDYPIPANDDARKTIELITGLISQAIADHKAVPMIEPTTVPVAPATVAELAVPNETSTDQAAVAKSKRTRTKKVVVATELEKGA